MRNSKKVGGQFEREICKLLTKWVTGKTKPVIFWRVGSSGAQATLSQSHTMTGDVVAVDEKGLFLTKMFTIELKKRKSLNLLQLFNEKCEFYMWWHQVTRDAKKAGNYPLLIFKLNNRGIYAVLSKEALMKFADWCGSIETFTHFILNKNNLQLIICKLQDLLTYLESWKNLYS